VLASINKRSCKPDHHQNQQSDGLSYLEKKMYVSLHQQKKLQVKYVKRFRKSPHPAPKTATHKTNLNIHKDGILITKEDQTVKYE
jgi:hypothetical protein